MVYRRQSLLVGRCIEVVEVVEVDLPNSVVAGAVASFPNLVVAVVVLGRWFD